MEIIGVRPSTTGGDCTDCEATQCPRVAIREVKDGRNENASYSKGAQLDIYGQNAVTGEWRDQNWSRRLTLLLRARVKPDPCRKCESSH